MVWTYTGSIVNPSQILKANNIDMVIAIQNFITWSKHAWDVACFQFTLNMITDSLFWINDPVMNSECTLIQTMTQADSGKTHATEGHYKSQII